MDKEQEYWLRQTLNTISNLSDIAILVIEARRGDLLPTMLELLYIEAQDLTDQYCIKEVT